MDKQKTYYKLSNLSLYLKENLLPRKEDIVKNVLESTPINGEPEGYFIKLFLAPLQINFLKENPEGLFIEGINSKGRTQFKKDFFGSKPAPDFIFKKYNTIGEVKYCKLRLRTFAVALGQLIAYIESSKNEVEKSQYGYLIFFNTEKRNGLTEQEKKFINLMWKRNNIFITII